MSKTKKELTTLEEKSRARLARLSKEELIDIIIRHFNFPTSDTLKEK